MKPFFLLIFADIELQNSQTSDPLKEEYRDAFLREASLHLCVSSSLYRYLQKLVRQWKLPHLDAEEILLESLDRGLQYIDKKGLSIENPRAWLRAVSINVVRDEAKATVRMKRLQFPCSVDYLIDESSLHNDTDLSEDMSAIALSMAELSDSDRNILERRFHQNKRYKEIQADLVKEGEGKIAIPTLRKRESRALKRLKAKFMERKRLG